MRLTRGLIRHARPPSPHYARTDPLDRGLVGEWRFDRATGRMLADWSGYGSKGQLTGNSFWSASSFGQCVHFDGAADYITIPSTDALNVGTGDFSVEIFFRAGRSGQYQTLIGKIYDRWSGTGGNGWQVFIADNSSLQISLFETPGGGITVNVNTVGITCDDGEWYHSITTCRRDSVARLYVNGIDYTSGAGDITAADQSLSNAYPLLIAANYNKGAAVDYEFLGDVGLARLYRRVLHPYEVSARYQIVRRRMHEPGAIWILPAPAAAAPAGEDVTVTPAAASAVASTQNPTVVHGSITITPTAASAVASTQNPSVIEGDIEITPTAASAVASAQDPTVVYGSVAVTPTASHAVASTQDPTVVYGSVTVAPAAAHAVASAPIGAVVEGDILVTPSPASAVASTQDPTVVYSSVTVTPATSYAVASTTDPVIVYGSTTASPSASNAVAAALLGAVVIGDVIFTPGAADAIASTVDPTVVYSSVTVTPAAADAIASTQDPTPIYGSVIVTPATRYAVASTVDPTVRTTGDVDVAPSAVVAVASTVDPTVVMIGSIGPTLRGAADTIKPRISASSEL